MKVNSFIGRARACIVLSLMIPAILASTVGTAGAAQAKAPAAPPGLDLSQLPAEVRVGFERGDVAIAPMTVTTARDFSASGDGGGATTQGAVQGNCGWVYFYIRNHAPNTLNLYWGFFDLCFLATSYQWTYGVGSWSFWRSDSGGGTLWFRREVSKSWTGSHGGTGWYDGCATLWAQNGPSAASGTACESHYVSS